jgi:NhaA family Na+:H+ antiporter
VSDERIHETWLNSDRTVPRRFVRPLLRFTHIEAAGGAILLIAAAVALIWANAPFGESYETFWHTEFNLEFGPIHLEESLQHLVNDGLMVIFFFVVGLEIKRELVIGDLRDPKAAALPVIAALGGMIVPALIYLSFAAGADAAEATRGWGIPMATDIAFAVGVVSLLGTRVPVGGKLFLLALAIADDIGAILVIAVFYTDDLSLWYLAGSIAALAAVAIASRVGIRTLAFYVPMALVAWYLLLESGVHATLAGVALGLLTPARAMYSDRQYVERAGRILDRYDFDAAAPRGPERVDYDALVLSSVARESVSPLSRIEDALHPWSSFVVVPIFALANAGVRFAGVDLLDAATHPVALGVSLGLLVGKFVGISTFTWLAVKLGLGKLPRLTGWTHIVGLAGLAGIGFTVSLFVTGLAFDDPFLTDRAKTGIFIGSTIAGVAGYFLLRTIRPYRAAGSRVPSGGQDADEPASVASQ